MNKSYDTEILSVGTELLLGHVTNTDARDISEMLSKIGINVKYHTVVGDNPERLRQCVETAKGRADIIITTGGLGPTCDDLTKQILAESFSLKLVENAEELQCLRDFEQQRHRFTENTFRQAWLPEGCTVFHNNWGTAPGCGFEAEGKIVVMMPGPPKECRSMFEHCALPYLKKLSSQQIVSHSVRVFGIGESTLDDMFAEEMNRMINPSMAPYAKECDCLLQITAKADSEAEAEAMIEPVMERVKERIGDFVYGVDVECVEEAVMELLQGKSFSFAAAESCTGGDIAKRFTALPGASAFFKGGAVTYTNEAKEKLLGIDHGILEEKGAVSYEVAKLMAENVRKLLSVDVGLSVTGLAGPDGDGVHEVGTVFIGFACEGGSFVREIHTGSYRTRSFVRRMAGNHAFDMLRRHLSGKPII